MIKAWDDRDKLALLVLGLTTADLLWLRQNAYQPMIIRGAALNMPSDVVLVYSNTVAELLAYFRRHALSPTLHWQPLPHATIKLENRHILIIGLDSAASRKLASMPLTTHFVVPVRRRNFEVMLLAGNSDAELRRHIGRQFRLAVA